MMPYSPRPPLFKVGDKVTLRTNAKKKPTAHIKGLFSKYNPNIIKEVIRNPFTRSYMVRFEFDPAPRKAGYPQSLFQLYDGSCGLNHFDDELFKI